MRRLLTLPQGDTAARLTLLGLVIALQNLLELPRPAFRTAPVEQLLGIGVFIALGGSLVLLVVALQAKVPTWRWLHLRWVQALVLLIVLAACPTGLLQVGKMATSPFAPPFYPNDGTTLDHYAAQQLLEGHNPYVTTDIVSAIRLYHQDPEHTTPLGEGAFAALFPLNYPDGQLLRKVFAAEPSGHPNQVVEFESHLSYPALAFLPLVPLVWSGLPTVTPFFVLCLLALVLLLVLSVPVELRLWVVILALADAPLLDSAVGGVLDLFYILLLIIAWRWWRQPLISVACLGLAIAAKQIAWFFLPFYAILIWRERGWREAVARLCGAGAIFLAINGLFILNNPHAWLAGILAPENPLMFPSGSGLVHLSTAGMIPLLPEGVYSILQGLALAAAVIWYWRYGKDQPEEIGLVLAVLPLFLAWRSLTTYFYFVALPAVILLVSRQYRQNPKFRFSGPVSLPAATGALATDLKQSSRSPHGGVASPTSQRRR
ncbi:MAG: hypothetical protein ACLQUY_13145 [Ktedonobacterales bacterium]